MQGTCTWGGYTFEVYPFAGTVWNGVGAVYIFAKQLPNQNKWEAAYIGETDSLRNRIPSHERWQDAAQLGATHVHVLAMPEATRLAVEAELIRAFQPRLNAQHLTGG